MAEKKSIFKAPAKKATPKAAPKQPKIKSDKELVLQCVRDAECVEQKPGLFNICLKSQKGDIIKLHSGLAKSESDAWKLAAHNL